MSLCWHPSYFVWLVVLVNGWSTWLRFDLNLNSIGGLIRIQGDFSFRPALTLLNWTRRREMKKMAKNKIVLHPLILMHGGAAATNLVYLTLPVLPPMRETRESMETSRLHWLTHAEYKPGPTHWYKANTHTHARTHTYRYKHRSKHTTDARALRIIHV